MPLTAPVDSLRGSHDIKDADRPVGWTAAALLGAAPVTLLLSLVLWRTPFPVTEAVAIFEDAVQQWPPAFLPEQTYYRPLFFATVGTIWRAAGSLDVALASLKLLQIIPVVTLVALFVGHARPRTGLEAASVMAAVAVLVGSPGFADNLELPLSYTTVGMPLALGVWVLLNRQPRRWDGALIVALTLVAIGFKEQGLVIVPVAIAARWTGARGATRSVTVALVAIAAAYVAARIYWRGSWSPFEQAIGLGFVEMEPVEAAARFGAFPYGIYLYNSVSTMANVLFAEPSRGVFRIVRAIVEGHAEAWQIVHAASSISLTFLIGWWGISAMRASGGRWLPETRVLAALVAALLACGALSFNYSRARLGGMAIPFYALAAYFAFRWAARRALDGTRTHVVATGLALALLAAGWHIRAVSTVEYARFSAQRNHREWLTLLPARRAEFAGRSTYLGIMESMIEQGSRPGPPSPTRYPSWMAVIGGAP